MNSTAEQTHQRYWLIAKVVAALLAVAAGFAIYQSDWMFFLLLLVILVEIGVVYAIHKNQYNSKLKELAQVVAAMAVPVVFIAAITLMYLFETHEYETLVDASPITSIDNLFALDAGKDVFITGTVSRKNKDYSQRRGEDCAIYSDRRDHNAYGPEQLLVEMTDGTLAVGVGYTLTAESNLPALDDPRLVLPRDCFMADNCWKCLRIGHAVSIRGTLTASARHSNKVTLGASQIFSGNSGAHAGYLLARTPKPYWSIFMAKLSAVLIVVFVSIWLYYIVRLLILWIATRQRPGA